MARTLGRYPQDARKLQLPGRTLTQRGWGLQSKEDEMKRSSFLALPLIALLFVPGSAFAEAAGSITVEKAWSRATPGGAQVAAGYLTIINRGDTPDRLVSVSTSVAGRTEIHQMKMADGKMEMRPVPDG